MKLDSVLGRGYLLGSEYLKYNNEDKRTYLAKAKPKCILGKINIKFLRYINLFYQKKIF